ncbi:hypothetical protein CRE_14057 [Caenorhabditis remanei]|uniref:Zc3h12a-like Ribonuclease NYN domain-containing protein n=1 Tax=Caenorhabditis remanei TaxID=31234 RepID=E3M913_CAERE|nr:hypothetical protein CRE_14057 [Caenorhabditis remanei]
MNSEDEQLLTLDGQFLQRVSPNTTPSSNTFGYEAIVHMQRDLESSNRQNLPNFPPETTNGPENGQENWELNEAIRISREEGKSRQSASNPRFGFHRNHRHFHSHQNNSRDDLEEEVPKEKWTQLEKDLSSLVDFLKTVESGKLEVEDPSQKYLNQVEMSETIKIYSKSDLGFRILGIVRSDEEQLSIDEANWNMLRFVYSRDPRVHESTISMEWAPMEKELFSNVDEFIRRQEKTAFRAGALSVAINFDDFPPNLTCRSKENETTLLRPVVVDGVAVLNATYSMNKTRSPFYGRAPEMPLYHDTLNYPVKAIFDVIMNFLIRGHKTVVYLPKYYKDYITPDGISKVDDVVAFRKLVELEYVQFLENGDRRRDWEWFHEVSKKADEIGAVFVSAVEYRRRTAEMKYEKPSERIITPCFFNAPERLMVLEPTIRYKEPGSTRYKTITEKEILQFCGEDEHSTLSEQLYLDKQIELICHLCQLYPMKALHRVCIQQLLHLVVTAKSDFEMPSMDLEAYAKFHYQFVGDDNSESNSSEIIISNNNQPNY